MPGLDFSNRDIKLIKTVLEAAGNEQSDRLTQLTNDERNRLCDLVDDIDYQLETEDDD